MKLEIEGSEEEISHLKAELNRRFPDQAFVFGPPKTPKRPFGSRQPLGEAVLVTVVVTAAATTLTAEIVKDIYKFIKDQYFGVEVKALPDDERNRG
jgi:hypothetical protein